MKSNSIAQTILARFASDYGMLLALLVLCAFFSWVTLTEQHPAGADAGEQVAGMLGDLPAGAGVLIVTQQGPEDSAFAQTLESRLQERGLKVVATVSGTPIDARQAMDRILNEGGAIDAIACTDVTAAWPIFKDLPTKMPALANTVIASPRSYRWPNFLKPNNLLNVANQIVVIAIIAIGMTMVIITGGIDLSVGSLIALSAVVTALLIRDAAGAESASVLGMVLSCLAAIAVCAAMGLFSGLMITMFGIPPFIVTLGMMLVASGIAYTLAEGQSVYQVPDAFIWLGRGTVLRGLPISVVMMAALYLLGHILMSRMKLGRHIYAVGGNREAARLSGVRVTPVLLFVYTLSGALAGLGGVVTASQLKSGSPTYGMMYELYVIAAVVVGGTSLTGGEGKVLGTLIGAFIIAVIQNGMNLTGVESYSQKIVFGLVILGAVLLDTLKKSGYFRLSRR